MQNASSSGQWKILGCDFIKGKYMRACVCACLLSLEADILLTSILLV